MHNKHETSKSSEEPDVHFTREENIHMHHRKHKHTDSPATQHPTTSPQRENPAIQSSGEPGVRLEEFLSSKQTKHHSLNNKETLSTHPQGRHQKHKTVSPPT